MKRAIRPVALVLLALVFSAAAPAPDVRAAPRAVPHGDAARTRSPLPSALHGQAPGDGVAGSGVAFDGTNYLAVWIEDRDGALTVYGARVTPDGTVLDQDGFAISAPGSSGPAVAFDGTNYLVVWSSQGSIVGARVDPDGTVLDPGGITISARPEAETYPTLAFDGTNYLVVWITGAEENIYGARVSPYGEVLDPTAIEIAAHAGFNETSPSVAFDGTNFLVVWQEIPCNRILGRRVSQSGVPDGDASFLISDCSEPGGPGGGLDPQVRSRCRVRRRQLSRDLGRLLRQSRWVLREHRRLPGDPREDRARHDRVHQRGGWYRDRGSPSLAFGGSTYLVVWNDAGVVRGARVTREGSVLDPTGFTMSLSGAQLPRGRLRRNELLRCLERRGRRHRVARDPGGRSARWARIPDHETWSAVATSAATPMQWSDHDSRNRPRRSVPVDLLDLGSLGHDHGRQPRLERPQPLHPGRHRHPARRPAGPGRDRDVGCGRQLCHQRNRPDARRPGC